MCQVSQITDDLHPIVRKAGKNEQKCDDGDIIAPMVFGIYHEGKLKGKAEEHYGEQWDHWTITPEAH